MSSTQSENTRAVVVDATTGSVTDSPIQDRIRQDYLGGSCLATRLWLESSRLEVDPLSAANALVIAPGMLTGFPITAANRTSLVAKSPLTGLLSESSAGGRFGPRMKAAGVDALTVRGSFDDPSYIVIDGDEGSVKVEKAGALWGQDVFSIYEALKERHGEDMDAAVIGPAGENGVHFAAVIFGGRNPASASRTGMGAVMGSKNLKAIVVRGGRPPEPEDPEGLSRAMSKLTAWAEGRAGRWGQNGRGGKAAFAETLDRLPVRNWRDGTFPAIREDRFESLLRQGIPYGTVGAFGTMCLVYDPKYIASASDLCNRLGLDAISAGSVVAFAMEAYERGIIDDAIAGRPLHWGDGEAVLFLLNEVANQQGLGAILSRGTRAAGKDLGALAEEFAIHVKGLEVPMHDPRIYTSMAVAYATGNRGACHLDGMTYYIETGWYPKEMAGIEADLEALDSKGKAEIAVKMQDLAGALNALGLTKSVLDAHISPVEMARWVECCLGIPYSPEDLIKAGERSFNLRRLCNVALGITRKDDRLPPRLLSHPRPSGRATGSLPFLGEMLHEYYALRGWDQEGLPTLHTLERLGLHEYPEWLGIKTRVLSR